MPKRKNDRWPFFAPYLKEKGFDPSDPFTNCDFDREHFAQNVINTVKSYKESNRGAVIGIDAGWGYGKSTFMDMLGAKMEKDKFTVVRFNAWETDFASDPLLAFIACFDEELGEQDKHRTTGRFFRILSKTAAFGALNKLTGTDLDKFVKDFNQQTYSSFLEEKESISTFKKELRKLVNEKGQVVILVDELDRCRPSYAIELLENIKHFFNVPGIVFLLAVNRNQLENAFQHVYGTEDLETSEPYFQKFVDYFIKLPDPNKGALVQVLYQQLGFTNFMVDERPVHQAPHLTEEDLKNLYPKQNDKINPYHPQAQCALLIESLIEAYRSKKVNGFKPEKVSPRKIEKIMMRVRDVFVVLPDELKNRYILYVLIFHVFHNEFMLSSDIPLIAPEKHIEMSFNKVLSYFNLKTNSGVRFDNSMPVIWSITLAHRVVSQSQEPVYELNRHLPQRPPYKHIAEHERGYIHKLLEGGKQRFFDDLAEYVSLELTHAKWVDDENKEEKAS